MLTTIIYRSHLCDEIPVSVLPEMVDKASLINTRHQVTGNGAVTLEQAAR